MRPGNRNQLDVASREIHAFECAAVAPRLIR